MTHVPHVRKTFNIAKVIYAANKSHRVHIAKRISTVSVFHLVNTIDEVKWATWKPLASTWGCFVSVMRYLAF